MSFETRKSELVSEIMEKTKLAYTFQAETNSFLGHYRGIKTPMQKKQLFMNQVVDQK